MGHIKTQTLTIEPFPRRNTLIKKKAIFGFSTFEPKAFHTLRFPFSHIQVP